jgi:hypothetical protein
MMRFPHGDSSLIAPWRRHLNLSSTKRIPVRSLCTVLLLFTATLFCSRGLQAMDMNQWAQWLKLQAQMDQFADGTVSGYEAYLDAQEQLAQIGSSGAGSGVGAGTVAAVGGSVVAITLSGVTIYYDVQLMQTQNSLLQQMQNPPAQSPDAPYYNSSVPLDLFDPFFHLSNYWYYFTHPFSG